MIEVKCFEHGTERPLMQALADGGSLEVVEGDRAYLDMSQPVYSIRLQREVSCAERPEEWLRAYADTFLSRDLYAEVSYDDAPYHALERAAEIQERERRHVAKHALMAPPLMQWLREQMRHVELERVAAVSSGRLQVLGTLIGNCWAARQTLRRAWRAPRA